MNFYNFVFIFAIAYIILTNMNLYKSNNDRMIYGVCGGLAERYGWDPSVVRVVVVLGTIFTGFWLGIIGYAAAAVIVPDAGRKVQ